MQTGADAGLPVPHQSVQTVLYGMIAVVIRHDGERRQHFLFAGQSIVLLKVEKQILHIGIGQGAGGSAPSQIPDNIHPVSQQVQTDSVPQQRVMVEHRLAVLNGVGGLAFLRCC